ncbi:MAG: response regulator [Rhodospirillaceae bacterium]|jgi:two-component system, cell cycle response regulator DivK|nr:response regulator [Rhodospirillaceae bacterium]MBT5243553.1 response regulator [Rhodospirillaceae bacterium]MBT5562141.1 response regulator [Rhodospirillaceae bacterium]MBT6242314.1 response regulator [Rhodospirillaceae bacterium]MBT7137674.1 response regulator [Rhodospirillaceae bacterium]
MAKTILIVEDNELNMRLFDQLLKSNGYDTIKSVDGSDAVDLAKDQNPDLIIMDIQLPGRSGLEITADLKADNNLKHIPVVAVTAFAMKGDESKILEAGCDDYIAKPISVPVFLDTVTKHLS